MRANGLTEETPPFTILTDWAAIAQTLFPNAFSQEAAL